MREWYAPATRLMLDLARIGPGNRVLDVAAGDGDQSLAAARRVGSSGYVLATDPARELLALRYLEDTSPTLRETLSSRAPDERKEAWKEIEQALSRYQGPAAFEVDHRILIAAGTRV
jgi:predicted methyltransferase